jgi:L-alanine-DL-glutamate epimerase-like enolase superfamily enzyme
VRITGIETYPVWGGARNLLFVVVDTDEGVYGVGEAGLTGRERAVMGTIEHFEPLLLGEDPFRTERLWQLLFRGGFFPARHAVSAAKWGYEATTLARASLRVLGQDERLRVVRSDVLDPASVQLAVRGQDAVVTALGTPNPRRPSTLLSEGTKNVLEAMEQHGVRRLVCVTILGTGDSGRRHGSLFLV